MWVTAGTKPASRPFEFLMLYVLDLLDMNALQTDEQAIRDVMDRWMRESQAGNSVALADLMSEDVVFLVAGRPPLRGRAEFLAGFEQVMQHVSINGSSEVQEIQVSGDLAYCWNRLSVQATPRSGGPERRRSGYTLSIFRKFDDGAWRLIRDANLLADE
jgi:uncharacterized protein (TIGR02246 family)